MKTKLLFAGLALCVTAFGADPSNILLSGKSIDLDSARVSGAARALVGDMTVSAETITFDRETNALKCDGAVSIKVAGQVVTATACVVELSAGEKSVTFLNPNGVPVRKTEAGGPRTEGGRLRTEE